MVDFLCNKYIIIKERCSLYETYIVSPTSMEKYLPLLIISWIDTFVFDKISYNFYQINLNTFGQFMNLQIFFYIVHMYTKRWVKFYSDLN